MFFTTIKKFSPGVKSFITATYSIILLVASFCQFKKYFFHIITNNRSALVMRKTPSACTCNFVLKLTARQLKLSRKLIIIKRLLQNLKITLERVCVHKLANTVV